MKVYIFVDMEGISGVTGSDFVTSSGPHYQTARRYYTEELNVCARACFEAGADEVIARDGHGSGNHMLWDQLDPRIQLVQGQTGTVRMWGLDGCDALILLGYHAMAGTRGALLEHTYSSASIQNMWLNGRPVG
ncbi:MAG: M55 family metallopeptidase, partial [Lentisphaeria bacterium]|nr:M55 family metallopeptidase [Lentisphaeria bacterium]